MELRIDGQRFVEGALFGELIVALAVIIALVLCVLQLRSIVRALTTTPPSSTTFAKPPATEHWRHDISELN